MHYTDSETAGKSLPAVFRPKIKLFYILSDVAISITIATRLAGLSLQIQSHIN